MLGPSLIVLGLILVAIPFSPLAYCALMPGPVCAGLPWLGLMTWFLIPPGLVLIVIGIIAVVAYDKPRTGKADAVNGQMTPSEDSEGELNVLLNRIIAKREADKNMGK
jgi:hypothetical protein